MLSIKGLHAKIEDVRSTTRRCFKIICALLDELPNKSARVGGFKDQCRRILRGTFRDAGNWPNRDCIVTTRDKTTRFHRFSRIAHFPRLLLCGINNAVPVCLAGVPHHGVAVALLAERVREPTKF